MSVYEVEAIKNAIASADDQLALFPFSQGKERDDLERAEAELVVEYLHVHGWRLTRIEARA